MLSVNSDVRSTMGVWVCVQCTHSPHIYTRFGRGWNKTLTSESIGRCGVVCVFHPRHTHTRTQQQCTHKYNMWQKLIQRLFGAPMRLRDDCLCVSWLCNTVCCGVNFGFWIKMNDIRDIWPWGHICLFPLNNFTHNIYTCLWYNIFPMVW